MNPEALAPKVPLYEQTIDLPAGDGSLQGAIDAMNARDALTKAMRKERRSKIKEANFLKAMG
jgi:large subunit ribosomal protein L54